MSQRFNLSDWTLHHRTLVGYFLLAIALQSVTDYPLRNQTILALAAFALLLLVRVATEERSERT